MTIDELAAEISTMGAEAVLLYGSVARGTARTSSDVDLFVIAPTAVQSRIDRRFGWERPIVTIDGVARRAHVLTGVAVGLGDVSAEFFCRMQPEAQHIAQHITGGRNRRGRKREWQTGSCE